ncbi:MAG: hypothetical protein H6709_00620 [Kofleriaceae bacterium]|nr:hypothetical protein [Kofleriaceae bacterium]MCB9570570.1 hypothetical protein [Kofleriaceae bacterium]
MPFRDLTPSCPRCRVDLARVTTVRDGWACRRCDGALLGVGDVIDLLLEVAPELMPTSGAVRDLRTVPRGRAEPLPCGLCGAAMDPVFLGGAEVDRCDHDGVLFFEDGELARVVARARTQHAARRSRWRRALARLLGY